MCAGHFQCRYFRYLGVLKVQHGNYRYRKPLHSIYYKHTIQGLCDVINLNYHFDHINFQKLILQTKLMFYPLYPLLHNR